MRNSLLLSCFLFVAAISPAFSQCSPATAYDFLDINNVKARINLVDMWWDLTSYASYVVPKDSGVSALFAGSLWLGGIDAQGNLKAAAQTYRQNGNDFFPGPLDENGNVTPDVCSNFDRIWKINKSTIDSFTAGLFSTIPNSIQEWPGRGNPSLTFLPDQDLAPFIDVNGDELYHPSDGDYPAMQGDQALWCVFNDKGNSHTETQGQPLGVEVKCMAYAYNSSACANNTTFYHYTIINKSGVDLSQVYFGFWADPDLGCGEDDFVGCDSNYNMGIVYNGEAIDGGGNCSNGYGDHPPYLGIKFLKTPSDLNGNEIGMTHFMHYLNDVSNVGNPVGANGYYDFLTSMWNDTTHLTYGGNGYGGTEPTNFAFPADPTDPNGWSECSAGNAFGDRRMVMSTGPFDFKNGTSQSLDVAVIWQALPVGSYPCPSFDSLRTTANCVQSLFDDAVFTPAPQATAEESTVKIFPNPSAQFITIIHPRLNIDEVIFKNSLGQSVKRTKLNGDKRIDISGLNQGIYLLQFINEGIPTAVSRLVVN